MIDIFDCLTEMEHPTVAQLQENPDRLYYFQYNCSKPHYCIVKYKKFNHYNRTMYETYVDVTIWNRNNKPIMTSSLNSLFFEKLPIMTKLW